MQAAREELESKLSYRFRNRELLQRALTHRSWLEGRPSSEPLDDNEQLEFLGDAVLGFVVSEALVLRFPKAKEGQLSRWKAHLVSAAHLYNCALNLGLGDYMLLGRGEDRNGGRERRTLLSDAVEALIAAMYLDGGIELAREFIETNILQDSSHLDELSLSNNQKVDLQNESQSIGPAAATLFGRGRRGPRSRESVCGRSPPRRDVGRPGEGGHETDRQSLSS